MDIKPISLHPELKKHIKNLDGRICIHHPFVVEFLYDEKFHDMYNKRYQFKLEHTKQYYQSKDWGMFIMMYERPYRLNALLTIINDNNLDQPTLGRLIKETWVDCESPSVNLAIWLDLFDLVDCPFYLMNDDEIQTFDKLPDEIIIYRGQSDREIDGISWTLSESRAEWFANRFNKNGIVYRKLIEKDHAIAYIDDRSEEEIIYVSDNLL